MFCPFRIDVSGVTLLRQSRLLSLARAAAAIAALMFAPIGVAAAEDNFRMTMTGCQPDSASIQNDTCRAGGHGVFAKRPGSPCRLICPMFKTNSSDQWDGLQLSGKDPDGTGSAYRIVAHLRKAPVGSTVSTILCSVDSNTGHSSTGYVARGCTRPGFTSFRPDAGTWYWLEVIISRAVGAIQEVEVLGYDIF
jgi:hypothetical protein